MFTKTTLGFAVILPTASWRLERPRTSPPIHDLYTVYNRPTLTSAPIRISTSA
jgi:hypothetical protein